MAEHRGSSDSNLRSRGIPAFQPATPNVDVHGSGLSPAHRNVGSQVRTVPALIVLYHSDVRRIGQRSWLTGLFSGQPVGVSRNGPAFSMQDDTRALPLEDSFISRQPLLLIGTDEGDVRIEARGPLRYSVQGQPGTGRERLTSADIDRGVLIALGSRVLLMLTRVQLRSQRLASHGMVGNSENVERIRSELVHIARVDVPVLIRGETGSGKERVARAIHAASARADKPFVAVNVAAIAPSAATSEFFGHRRGAFTGAVVNYAGFFGAANGGTLFLDEIGEASAAVQTLLLRALDEGEIQPVGGLPRQVDVRLIAATDADLEHDVATGRFRDALLHRIQVCSIDVAPLRRRREDIPMLLMHFLEEQLHKLGATARLAPPRAGEEPWLSLEVVQALIAYDWPGNVRQLRNIAKEIAILGFNSEVAVVPPSLHRAQVGRKRTASGGFGPRPRHAEGADGAQRDSGAYTRRGDNEGAPAIDHDRRSAGAGQSHASGARRAPRARAAVEPLSDADIVAVLRDHRWNVTASAQALGIAKNTLVARMAGIDGVRRANELSLSDIDDARREVGDHPRDMAMLLRVSERGLRLRGLPARLGGERVRPDSSDVCTGLDDGGELCLGVPKGRSSL